MIITAQSKFNLSDTAGILRVLHPKDLRSLESEATQSRFLNSLSEADRALVLRHCRAVVLPINTVLWEPEVTPFNAYILTSGLASVITSMPNGDTVEVGVLGREGVSATLHLIGPSPISTRCVMQLEGTALCLPFPQLAGLFARSPTIRARLLEFVQSQTACLGQIAACHRLHLADQRLARWLLMVQDRVESHRVDLTQEFLANMLGSRRTTVTKAAGALERAGAIQFSRGHLRIVDRERLIASACVCYPVAQQLLSALYAVRIPAAA